MSLQIKGKKSLTSFFIKKCITQTYLSGYYLLLTIAQSDKIRSNYFVLFANLRCKMLILIWFFLLNMIAFVASQIIVYVLRFNSYQERHLCYQRLTSNQIEMLNKFIDFKLHEGNLYTNIVIKKHYFLIRIIIFSITNLIGLVQLSFLATVYILLVTSVLSLLAVIDINHLILPDKLTRPLLWLGLLWPVTSGLNSAESAIIGAAGGYSLFWAIAIVGRAIYAEEVIGRGDVKLIAALGGCLSWHLLGFMLLIACGITLVIIPICRKKNLKHRYPFGPGLAIAGIILLCWRLWAEQSSVINLPIWPI